jgi:hypothetical protein
MSQLFKVKFKARLKDCITDSEEHWVTISASSVEEVMLLLSQEYEQIVILEIKQFEEGGIKWERDT